MFTIKKKKYIDEKIYYFAYGSNLCEERLSLSVPNPTLECIAELQDYELVFTGFASKHWRGSPATIRHRIGKSVTGAVWAITNADIFQLDKQEGVSYKIYKQLFVEVKSLQTNETIKCLTYQKYDPEEPIGKPSPAYKNVILNGARKVKLPIEYIEYLESFEDNGYTGEIAVKINKAFTEGRCCNA